MHPIWLHLYEILEEGKQYIFHCLGLESVWSYWLQRCTRKFSRVMKVFYILIIVMFTQVYILSKLMQLYLQNWCISLHVIYSSVNLIFIETLSNLQASASGSIFLFPFIQPVFQTPWLLAITRKSSSIFSMSLYLECHSFYVYFSTNSYLPFMTLFRWHLKRMCSAMLLLHNIEKGSWPSSS